MRAVEPLYISTKESEKSIKLKKRLAQRAKMKIRSRFFPKSNLSKAFHKRTTRMAMAMISLSKCQLMDAPLKCVHYTFSLSKRIAEYFAFPCSRRKFKLCSSFPRWHQFLEFSHPNPLGLWRSRRSLEGALISLRYSPV